MTAYTAITDSSIDQDSPVTEPLMVLLRNNPIAMMEVVAGAPKMAQSFQAGVEAAGTDLVFTGLEEFGGGFFICFVRNATGASVDLLLGISDDSAGTWETGTVLSSASSDEQFIVVGMLDHATLTARWIKMNPAGGVSPTYGTHTFSSTTTAITDVKFDASSALVYGAVYLGNGGNSAV